ncbi:hypothetical protein [Streptomyces chromofuscus]|uniref:Uncharacterized protein n=1 Tax=Streptomyces chromofuscus TaxID=42881 RepID=A0A7M2T757_STRCW|nr:hypothetical protein [Streptomyces chromofuscus]QOV44064.1 hypothetical protein IPT68_31135 [Streptomyces chromofuscus]
MSGIVATFRGWVIETDYPARPLLISLRGILQHATDTTGPHDTAPWYTQVPAAHRAGTRQRADARDIAEPAGTVPAGK